MKNFKEKWGLICMAVGQGTDTENISLCLFGGNINPYAYHYVKTTCELIAYCEQITDLQRKNKQTESKKPESKLQSYFHSFPSRVTFH